MELQVPRGVLADIQAHARAAYPEECCGFLIGKEMGADRVVTESRRAKNVHPEMREVRYTIDPREVLRVDREFGGEVRHVGFYHSHPGHPARPSEFDHARAWRYYVYAILAVDAQAFGEFTAWTLDEGAREFRPVSVRPV